MAFAHSENSRGKRHDLAAHLRSVAELAAEFASSFEASDLAHWAGLWHDVGKYSPAFQEYLANPGLATRGPDHKGAGAILAGRYIEPLAFLIAGHHGGLQNRETLKPWLCEKQDDPVAKHALAIGRTEIASLEPISNPSLPGWLDSETKLELFLRMLFSALVDADFLDTERHFDEPGSAKRRRSETLDDLWACFEKSQAQLTGKLPDRVNRIRHEVYQSCCKAALLRPGFFRLTVPTGGGKTRSSLAFGLLHSLRYGMERVIVAIPYTSIIEQTAAVYRDALGGATVIEHHSAVTKDDPNNPTPEEVKRRLASENWDARIIVTTTVQLFESIFSSQTSRCRKLHNIAKSVLILDEVQTLPSGLLAPILDALRQLVAHYSVTVVLCTATQPALDDSPFLKGLPDVREIAPDPSHLFAELKRVSYEWKNDVKATWEQVADEMRKENQALAITNTKADALALLDALALPEALHLSTLMCGAHRRDTLNEIMARLNDGAPCHLVSTQVVEAGVDLDFPVVLRALGPLDRIVQAAGRCNREGKLGSPGRVVIFEPAHGKLPGGAYRTGTALAAMQLLAPGFDFDDPQAYEKYFRLLYRSVSLDIKKIQELRQDFCYAEVSRRFRMIEDNTVPVVVRPPGADYSRRIDELIGDLRCRQGSRSLFRAIQPYLVNVRARLVSAYQKQGLLGEIIPNVWEWLGRYDGVRGIDTGNRDPGELVV